ncbi:hypothetical protein [Mycetocola lacteus]|uniref:hypothetical protein n=1 Tax=Mycetocola lacteus TaxID=76637 RepID=UPI0011C48C07|nr:hypothetical protein [Mycetocola lacteus]
MGSDTEARCAHARALLANGLAAEALVQADAILTDSPHFPAAREVRAWALSALDRGSDAISQAEQSVARDPYSADTHLQLATLLRRHHTEDWYLSEARTQAEIAWEIDPENPRARELIERLPRRPEPARGPTTYPAAAQSLAPRRSRPVWRAYSGPRNVDKDYAAELQRPEKRRADHLGRVLQSARHACWIPVVLAGLYLIVGPTQNPWAIFPAFVLGLFFILIGAPTKAITDEEVSPEELDRELASRPLFEGARILCMVANSLASIGLFLLLVPLWPVGVVAICLLFLVGVAGLIAVQMTNAAALAGAGQHQAEIVRRASVRRTLAIFLLLGVPVSAHLWAPSILVPWASAAAGTLLLVWSVMLVIRDWFGAHGRRRGFAHSLGETIHKSPGRGWGRFAAGTRILGVVLFEALRVGPPLLIIWWGLHP